MVGELLLHALDVRVRLVDLVDRDDDRDLRGPRVVDRLDRLRHDAVVGRDDEHDDVRRLGAAGAHEREGLVAGSVEEDDRLALRLDAVGADVLRDPAGLAGRDLRLADRVEERRLAVVDVAHDRDDRRARHALRRVRQRRTAARACRLRLRAGELELLLERDDGRFDADLLRDLDRERASTRLVDRGDHPPARSAKEVRARTPSFSESSLTVTPSERKTGPSAVFLNSTSLPVSVAASPCRPAAGRTWRAVWPRGPRPSRRPTASGCPRTCPACRCRGTHACFLLEPNFFVRGFFDLPFFVSSFLTARPGFVASFFRRSAVSGSGGAAGPPSGGRPKPGRGPKPGPLGPPGRGAKPGARCEARARREARGTGRHAGPGTGGHDGRRRADGAQGAGARRRDDGAAEAAGRRSGERPGSMRGASLRGRRRRRGTHGARHRENSGRALAP